MLATGMPIINAVGSSLVAVAAFGLTTAGNYALSGLVDWLVAASFIAGGTLGGFLGTSAAHRFGSNSRQLTTVFASLIIVVAVYMFARSTSFV